MIPNSVRSDGLRWQAPELMSGQSLMNKKTDVYAYAMCCVEILTMGSVPWPGLSDEFVKHSVLGKARVLLVYDHLTSNVLKSNG